MADKIDLKTAIRVVHITEAFASGTLEAMRQIVASQVDSLAEVSVIHSKRSDSPSEEGWDELFPASVVRFRVSSKTKILALLELAWKSRMALKNDSNTVVHVHSSLAGLFVRALMMYQRENRRILYSPHGFAFLRQDISGTARLIFRLAERFLARHCGGLMLVSQSEAELVRHWVPSRKITVVENAVDLSVMPSVGGCKPQPGFCNTSLVVASMGRVTYQKAPWKFAQLARTLGHRARFVWIGDGPDLDKKRWFDNAPVEVTGWLNRQSVNERLLSASIFVLPSLWEGMPLALIEAQCLGIPAVASNVVGNRDVILDGVSGLLVNDDADFVSQVAMLLDENDVRARMSLAALSQRKRFDQQRLGMETLAIYRKMLGDRF